MNNQVIQVSTLLGKYAELVLYLKFDKLIDKYQLLSFT